MPVLVLIPFLRPQCFLDDPAFAFSHEQASLADVLAQLSVFYSSAHDPDPLKAHQSFSFLYDISLPHEP